MAEHMAKKERAVQIIAAAMKLAKRHGFRNVSRDAIAIEAGISAGLVSKQFGNMDGLRDELMRAAVRDSVLPIVAQGLGERHKIALRAPVPVRNAAARLLSA